MKKLHSLALSLVLTGCLSSAPPAAPARYFDPLPAYGQTPVSAAGSVQLSVAAASHLSQDFVVRVAPREVVFDAEHRWIAEPAQLVAAALAAFEPGPEAQAWLRVRIERFELDVISAPQAHIYLTLTSSGRLHSKVVDTVVPAVDRSPEALAAAMAEALQKAALAVAAAAGN